MNNFKENNRAKAAAMLAKKDSENIKRNGTVILEYYRSGWSVVEIAALTNESEASAIRISAIRSFINQVNSIISLIKAHVEGLSAKEIALKLNIEINIVIEELKWFQQSEIVTQQDHLWIHKKYEQAIRKP